MTKDAKIKAQVVELNKACGAWLCEVSNIGNQCAYTDRGLEEILMSALKLASMYEGDLAFCVERYKNEDAYESDNCSSSKNFTDFEKAQECFYRMRDNTKTGIIVFSWGEQESYYRHIIKRITL